MEPTPTDGAAFVTDYEAFLAEYEMQCELFDQMAEVYMSYDPSAMNWGEQMAIFDPEFAQSVLEMHFDTQTGPSAADVWADMDQIQDVWMAPPEQYYFTPEIQLDFQAYEQDLSEQGTRLEDLSNWNQQDHPYSCAVATCEMILDGYGLDFSEADIAKVFTDAGIYDPEQGTAPKEIDETLNALFEKQGIALEAKEVEGWRVEDLQEMLDRGVKPLIALDSAETWPGNETETMNEFNGIPDAGHAVQLIDIEDGPDGKVVVLNDPAAPEGQGMKVPMATFLDACEDFGNLAIAVEKKAA